MKSAIHFAQFFKDARQAPYKIAIFSKKNRARRTRICKNARFFKLDTIFRQIT